MQWVFWSVLGTFLLLIALGIGSNYRGRFRGDECPDRPFSRIMGRRPSHVFGNTVVTYKDWEGKVVSRYSTCQFCEGQINHRIGTMSGKQLGAS